MGKNGVGSMRHHQNCKLIYCRKYSDFCFQTEDDFTVRVSENQDGQTEIFVFRDFTQNSRLSAMCIGDVP